MKKIARPLEILSDADLVERKATLESEISSSTSRFAHEQFVASLRQTEDEIAFRAAK